MSCKQNQFPLCLAKGLSDSSTTWWWELLPGSTFGIKMCHRRCFLGLLWPSSILSDSAYGWWNEESDIPLARQRCRDFVSYDTSLYGNNSNKCQSHYISFILYTWSNYVYAYIYRYIHTYIHTYMNTYFLFSLKNRSGLYEVKSTDQCH